MRRCRCDGVWLWGLQCATSRPFISASASESPIALAPTSGSATCSDATGGRLLLLRKSFTCRATRVPLTSHKYASERTRRFSLSKLTLRTASALVEGSTTSSGVRFYLSRILEVKGRWHRNLAGECGASKGKNRPSGWDRTARRSSPVRHERRSEIGPSWNRYGHAWERALTIQVPLANLEQLGPSFSWSAGATFYSSGAEMVQWADNCNAEWNDMTKVNAFPG